MFMTMPPARSSALVRQLEQIERWVPVALALHGFIIAGTVDSSPVIWAVTISIMLVGLSGHFLAKTPQPSRPMRF
jgi:hypothetical protein